MIATLLLAAAALSGSKSDSTSPDEIAVLKWSLRGFSNAERTTLDQFVSAVIDARELNQVSSERIAEAWRDIGIPDRLTDFHPRDYLPDLPRKADLIRLGKQLGVRFVCVGRAELVCAEGWNVAAYRERAFCYADVVVCDAVSGNYVVETRRIKAANSDTTDIFPNANKAFSKLEEASSSRVATKGYKTRAMRVALSMAFEAWLAKVAGVPSVDGVLRPRLGG